MTDAFLGIDVGSVSTNLVLIDNRKNILHTIYFRTLGQPIQAVKGALRSLQDLFPDLRINGVGATGSARNLVGVLVGADVIKNEITCHAIAATHMVPEVKTIFEIGGQDSKIIIVRNGIVTDFAMNTVCAAGTGSFLDQQANRLGLAVENFGDFALQSKNPVRIAGRCTVFAESDMIHKQQMGHDLKDIIAGLCQALVRNYLNNVGKGKEILPPIVFQGGVAANSGIKAAFEQALGYEVLVPPYFNVLGALGAALLAMKQVGKLNGITNFKGFAVAETDYLSGSFDCQGCSNLCEIVNISTDGRLLARWGSRCGKWDTFEE